MASPQVENGFLRLSNELAEALIKVPLNGSQWRILMAVVRECYGRNGGQKVAVLPLRRLAAMTGMDRRNVRREVKALVTAGVMVRQEANGSGSLLGIGKDYEAWTFGKGRGLIHPRGSVGDRGRGSISDREVVASSPPHRRKEEEEKNTSYYNGQHLQITVVQHENLRRAYPNVDLNSEYPRMDVYLDTRPAQARWKNFYQGARNWCARIKTPQQGGNYGRNRPTGSRDTRAMQGGLARFENIGRKAAPAVDGDVRR